MKSKQKLPLFGEYRKKRDEITQEFFQQVDLLAEQFQPEQVRPPRQPQQAIPRLVDVRGIALDKIGDFRDLDPREPAVAIIDDVRNVTKSNPIESYLSFIGFMC